MRHKYHEFVTQCVVANTGSCKKPCYPCDPCSDPSYREESQININTITITITVQFVLQLFVDRTVEVTFLHME